ncbi:MAG: CHAD domain-containing protein [Deltaproteobacteria bacterium]|nr:CHAD domain-containing protein [Deltaproteobacteria bacterium]
MAGEEEAVHQIRVCSRRLRVAVLLLAGKPDGKRARRVRRLLAQLTRTAGDARDLDVLLSTFDGRLRQVAPRTAAQNRLRHRLASLRRRGRAHMMKSLLDRPLGRLRADLAELASRACPDLALLERRFRALCADESRRLLDGFAALGALLDVAALHALRRRARRVRYGVEIFVELFDGEASATKPWKTLQEIIGVLHDHHALAEWLGRQAQLDKQRGHDTLAATATGEASWAQQTVRRLHDELLAADPANLVGRGLAAVGCAPQPQAR